MSVRGIKDSQPSSMGNVADTVILRNQSCEKCLPERLDFYIALDHPQNVVTCLF